MRRLPTLLMLLALVACGQTGPLQMPPAPREAPPPPSAADTEASLELPDTDVDD